MTLNPRLKSTLYSIAGTALTAAGVRAIHSRGGDDAARQRAPVAGAHQVSLAWFALACVANHLSQLLRFR